MIRLTGFTIDPDSSQVLAFARGDTHEDFNTFCDEVGPGTTVIFVVEDELTGDELRFRREAIPEQIPFDL